MPVEGLAFLADDFAKPITDYWTGYVVVVSPIFIACVIGRIDRDTFDLPRVIRKQCLESDEVVALDNEVAIARLAASEIGYVFKKVKGDLQVVIDHPLFPNPV